MTTCIQNKKHLALISWGHKRRRSRKALSSKSESFGKRKDVDDMPVVKTHFGTENPAKRFCMTEPVILSVRSMSSSDKFKEHKSFAETSKNLKEYGVLNNSSYAEVNNVSLIHFGVMQIYISVWLSIL